jgi:tetratricopeptide (TPR) repeat protein
MTAQVSSSISYKGKEYLIVAIENTWPFDPERYGIQSTIVTTANWSGYYCRYSVTEGMLLLSQFSILSEKTPKIWNDISPRKGGFDEYTWEYDGVNFPIIYTGGIVIGRDFLKEYLHNMGYPYPHSCRYVIEIFFKNGQIQNVIDHSLAMEVMRRKIKSSFREFKESQMKEMNKSFVSNAFSLSYSDKWSYDSKSQIDQVVYNYIDNYYSEVIGRAHAYSRKGQFDQAISEYTKAVEIKPWNADSYYIRGDAYYREGQFDQAIADYTKTIELSPRHLYAYNNRGHAYCEKGQFDQAVSDYTEAIEINPRYPKTYNYRGRAYFYLKKYDNAWSDVNKAQSLGYKVQPEFLKNLREASGRER